jgi:hypothetical protein
MVIIITDFVDQNIYHSSQMAKYPPRTLEIRLKISSVSHTGSMVSAGCYRAKDLEPFSSAYVCIPLVNIKMDIKLVERTSLFIGFPHRGRWSITQQGPLA